MMDVAFSAALGLSLSMDAFAVSCAMGLCGISRGEALKVALSFGLFQAIMPLVGWLGARWMGAILEPVDHWVAFLALLAVGGKMVIEGLGKVREAQDEAPDRSVCGGGKLLSLSIGTSIDALAVGVGFIGMRINVPFTASVIGVVTFIVCLLGALCAGRILRTRRGYMEVLGGLVISAIGIKILLEHLLG